jgi:putative sugar O-methyltransferase
LLKIRSAHGLFNERDLNAIYTAWSLKQLLPPDAALAEIGAGSGRVAYWSWRFGFRSLTIFDLPHINVIQGYYLIKALPGAPITLFGETAAEESRQGVTILPGHRIHSDVTGHFDLVLNQDSFPEIDMDAVRSYLQRIKALSNRYFLSINHESRPRSVDGKLQLNVPQVVAEVGGYRRAWRMPYWLRRGYVFELYEISR